MKGIPRNHAELIEVTWCPFRKDSQDVTSRFKNGTSDEDTSRFKNGTSDEVTSRFKNGTSDEVTSRLKNVMCEVTSPLKKVQHDLLKKKCVQRKCPMCGVTKYERDLIQKNRFQMRTQKEVKWRQWEQIKIGHKKGKATYRTELCMKTGSIVNLMKLYTKQLQSMSLHQFFKVWQLRNFNLTINNLQRGQVLFVHDFQQNLLLITQDESSGSHWDHPQLTIHPTSVYYHCSKCDELVKEDIIHITMDKSHNKHGVNQFIATTIDHLKKKDVTINEIIEFTDHASSQYKSRFTFYYMTLLDVPCTRHYFGVKHSKGPSDRTGANFKCKIRSAVRAGKILLSADAIAEYCRENFDRQIGCGSDECDVNECDVNKRDVNKRDVNKQNPHSLFKVYHHSTILRPKKELKLRQLKGSRDYLHAVRNTGIKGVVEYRNFDCGCLSCTTHTNECLQSEYADEWKKFSLVPGKKMDLSFNTCDWFKAVEVGDRRNNDAFMQFEEEIDNTVHCDEIENEDYTERYVTEEIVDTDVTEERDVTEDERDVTEDERDVTEEEREEEIVEEGDRDVTEEERDVTEEGNDSDDSLVELYTIPYESSSDNSSDEELPAIYQPEMSPVLSDEDACIHLNWDAVLKDMKTYTTFNSLKQYVSRTWLPEVSPDIKYILDDDDIIDTIAQHFYPSKDGPKGYMPVETCGDGNCGYRALAQVMRAASCSCTDNFCRCT